MIQTNCLTLSTEANAKAKVAIANIEGIHELNIGHAIMADSVFMGLQQAVVAMRAAFAN